MSQKTELQEKAKALKIDIKGLTVAQLEEAISKVPQPSGEQKTKKEKVVDMEGKEIKEVKKDSPKPPVPEPIKPIVITLEDVNSYLNIIGIILVDDIRGQGLSSHFMKMIQARNPQIKTSPSKQ